MTQLPSLLEGLKAGRVRALAKAISLVEDDPRSGAELVAGLGAFEKTSLVLGITGATGVGKSTLIKALIDQGLAAGRRVGVLAVDPSSPLSGGALLGDRFRMMGPDVEPEKLFIRSLASRGNDGGISRGLAAGVRLLQHAGYDVILVETTGAGQCEFQVVRVVDVVCLLLAEGFGDELQAMKSGLMEVADVLVVNKCRRPGTENLRRDLESHLAHSSRCEFLGLVPPPVMLTDGLSGDGVGELWQRVHQLAGDGVFLEAAKRKRRYLARVSTVALVLDQLKGRMLASLPGRPLDMDGNGEDENDLRQWMLQVCREELATKE
jgi:LAO/AO transport system kinase